MKYELNALRLLSSHVPAHEVRAFAVRDCSCLAPIMDQDVSDCIASDVIYRGWRIQGVIFLYLFFPAHDVRAFLMFFTILPDHAIRVVPSILVER